MSTMKSTSAKFEIAHSEKEAQNKHLKYANLAENEVWLKG